MCQGVRGRGIARKKTNHKEFETRRPSATRKRGFVLTGKETACNVGFQVRESKSKTSFLERKRKETNKSECNRRRQKEIKRERWLRLPWAKGGGGVRYLIHVPRSPPKNQN